MRQPVLWLGLLFLLLASPAVIGHDEDDEEEAVVVEDNDDGTIHVERVELEDNIAYFSPEAHPDHFFADHFDEPATLGTKWIRSQAKKDGTDAAIAKYDGEWAIQPLEKNPLTGDNGLVLKSKAKHAAVAAKLKKPFKFEDKPLVVQYEIAFQNGQDCGGGYIKLLSDAPGLDLRQFTDKTPYSIMFGPDKCGSDSKLHFIFRHMNPLTKQIEEKHCKKPEGRNRATLEEVFKDKNTHLFRLLLRPDNTFEISIDHTLINHGSLLDSFEPPVNPPAEIDDPNDKMPADWDEREKIQDPEAVKPDDWDESAPRQIPDTTAEKPDGWLDDEPDMVPDPEATKPADWDNEMDGEWEAPLVANPACSDAPGCGIWRRPLIDNPEYKGKWYPPMINNPNYKGKWKPAKIPNPDYFRDDEPFKMAAIGAVGIELWSMSDNIYFDNLLVADSVALADAYAADTFGLKMSKLDVASGGMFRRLLDYSNKNPWLYAVYVVLVGLPLVLTLVFCCSSSGDKDKGGKSALNDPKKTDAVQADDQEDEEEEEEMVAEGGDTEAQNQGAAEEEEESQASQEEEEEEEQPVQTRSSARKRKPRKE